MLKAMQYPCCDLDSEIFDSEDSYSEYFGYDDEEELKQCIIPDSLKHTEALLKSSAQGKQEKTGLLILECWFAMPF